jgi:hypothetical protein
MSEAPLLQPGNDEPQVEDVSTPTGLALAPESVVVRRNAGLAALVGGLSSAVAIAWAARAAESGGVVDWTLAVVLGLLGIGHLAALLDARTPLLVADSQGVRMRLGRTWGGLPWGALARVEHTPRRGLLRDGRLVMVVHNPARLLEELDRGARQQSRLCQRLYGAPFALPLGLSTRVSGAGADLTEALTALAAGSSRVVEIGTREPETGTDPVVEPKAEAEAEPQAEAERHLPDPRPRLAHALFRISGLLQRERPETDADAGALAAGVDVVVEEVDAADVPVVASATPSPLRLPTVAARAEVRVEPPVAEEDEQAGRELRRPGSVSLVEDTQVWGDRVSPIAREGHAVEPLLIDDHAVRPADDPVVGPELAAARTRLALTVDQLAERTRIRPHVIESIEVDDFTPCGGDFYARGHLRTLARVLGVDVAPLLTAYDDRYADAPINPRRVFEAELATGAHGSIRGTRGGPNWSVLVAAVMAVVLAWSVARLAMDSPSDVPETRTVLNGSAGLTGGTTKAAPAVPVVLTAAGGGAKVTVRDGRGTVVFQGGIAFGESKTLEVSPPVRVESSDGSLTTTVDGQDNGPIGATGQRASDLFVVTD